MHSNDPKISSVTMTSCHRSTLKVTSIKRSQLREEINKTYSMPKITAPKLGSSEFEETQVKIPPDYLRPSGAGLCRNTFINLVKVITGN